LKAGMPSQIHPASTVPAMVDSETGIYHRRNCACRMYLARHTCFQASAAWFVDFLSAAPWIHGDRRLRRGRWRGQRLPDRPGNACGTIHAGSDWDKRNFQPFDQCFSNRAVVADMTEQVSAPQPIQRSRLANRRFSAFLCVWPVMKNPKPNIGWEPLVL
jgi:hypothetical protein